ncbi:hypothetical protein L873DRAFT_1494539 [Choiromyces venosus 120613-1]|uniref:Uncharacterized protein n=1 Tax=Choiromyces venosus 120613-1 TaxID=1336337 RepID=A0A3N4J6U0_9PEZI|nr:hypothetical protein L873DRAFT_1494539 [Choiromyces venosus 120613-1]
MVTPVAVPLVATKLLLTIHSQGTKLCDITSPSHPKFSLPSIVIYVNLGLRLELLAITILVVKLLLLLQLIHSLRTTSLFRFQIRSSESVLDADMLSGQDKEKGIKDQN